MENTLILTGIISGGLIFAILVPIFLASKLKLAINYITKDDSPQVTVPQVHAVTSDLVPTFPKQPTLASEWKMEFTDDDDDTTDLDDFNPDEFEWLPMAESILLKQAEEVVDEIQNTINHIASLPANPEEVRTKLNNIISNYAIFKNTEYYEAINNYVSISVKRDCNIELTEKEIHQLWH